MPYEFTQKDVLVTRNSNVTMGISVQMCRHSTNVRLVVLQRDDGNFHQNVSVLWAALDFARSYMCYLQWSIEIHCRTFKITEICGEMAKNKSDVCWCVIYRHCDVTNYDQLLHWNESKCLLSQIIFQIQNKRIELPTYCRGCWKQSLKCLIALDANAVYIRIVLFTKTSWHSRY